MSFRLTCISFKFQQAKSKLPKMKYVSKSVKLARSKQNKIISLYKIACSLLSAVEQDAATAAIALSGDESMLIVRGSHTELIDGEKTVISQFIVVDVITGQVTGTVGPPYRGVAPAHAEFIADTGLLLVTCDISFRQAAGETFTDI